VFHRTLQLSEDPRDERRLARRGWIGRGFAVIAASLARTTIGSAAPPVTKPERFGQVAAAESVQWLADFAAARMPRIYEGDKGWGETKRVWAGVSVRRDGWRIRTHRKHRDVDHGRWVRYRLEFSPTRRPSLNVLSAEPVFADDHILETWRIKTEAIAEAKFAVRMQRHRLGVRMWSVSVDGIAKLRLRIVLTVAAKPDYSTLPPGIAIKPIVEKATIDLRRFEVERVSHLGGDAAELWGELAQETIVELLIDQQNKRLTRKLNRAIRKHRDDLRISWLSID